MPPISIEAGLTQIDAAQRFKRSLSHMFHGWKRDKIGWISWSWSNLPSFMAGLSRSSSNISSKRRNKKAGKVSLPRFHYRRNSRWMMSSMYRTSRSIFTLTRTDTRQLPVNIGKLVRSGAPDVIIWKYLFHALAGVICS